MGICFRFGRCTFESSSVEDGIGSGFGPKEVAGWVMATASA